MFAIKDYFEGQEETFFKMGIQMLEVCEPQRR